MSKYLVIIIAIVLISCATTKNGNTKTLKLTNAESQAFTLGKQALDGKTSGVAYSSYFSSKGDIKIKRVWIKGVNIDFEQVISDANGSFRLRSTFYRENKKNIHESVKAPIEYTGEGLVEYVEGNETKYLVIKEFTKKDKVSGYK